LIAGKEGSSSTTDSAAPIMQMVVRVVVDLGGVEE
jgi:hypothetical protein